MATEPLNSPIPAPSEAQLDAGAQRDPNANLVAPGDAQPPMSDDQRSTSIDGNAPHTQPDGSFTGSENPDERLDEGKTPARDTAKSSKGK